MMSGQPVILSTDWLVYLLVAVIVSAIVYIRRRPQLRAPWQRVAQSKSGMIGLTVLLVFVLVGLLDSVHFRPRLQTADSKVAYSVEVQSLLDVAVEHLRDRLRLAGGPDIECVTLPEGPRGIETQEHVESVVLPLQRTIRARDNDADAFVIACFSDPGIHLARETTRKPVFGIAESAYLTALTRGERFGVISILATSIPRHLRQIRQLGLLDRFAGDRAIGLGVGEELRGHAQNVDQASFVATMDFGGDRHPDATLANAVLDGDHPHALLDRPVIVVALVHRAADADLNHPLRVEQSLLDCPPERRAVGVLVAAEIGVPGV